VRRAWPRAAVLAALLALGATLGYAGSLLTGDDAWYLAIPAAVAAGWLALADPTRCEPAGSSRRKAR
jgi:hypothetical protein